MHKLAALTGESLTSAMVAIGQDCAYRLKEPFRSAEHGDLLDDDRGVAALIVDSPALLAILRAEPEASACAQAIEDATSRRISAATFLETAMVIDGSRDPVLK